MSDHGTLQVTVKRAHDLVDVQWIGKQDPYCIVKVSGHSLRSRTDNDGAKNPVWNDTLTFHDVPTSATIKIEIIDQNPSVFKDVHIGHCQLLLSRALSENKEDYEIPVRTSKGSQQGFILVGVKFTPTASPSPAPKPGGKTIPRQVVQPPRPGKWIFAQYGGRDVSKEYSLGRVLGKGAFGTTVEAKRLEDGRVFACKTLSKKRINTIEEVEDVVREVQIMHHLVDHPNVVHLMDVYEDRDFVHMVMEICRGGELFDRIVEMGKYTERDAAAAVRTIVSVVAHCHQMNVIHRDLKPENFLLSDRSPHAVLKATDFGLSVFYREGQLFSDLVGSAYYVAPEVLRRQYGKEADIWSCGVILYILLSGQPPFHGDNEDQIFLSIKRDNPDFKCQPWPQISPLAIDCVRHMLEKDPKRRATAEEILKHDWLRENGEASDKPIQLEVVKRIKNFAAMNRLKKEALMIIANNLPMTEVMGLKEMFEAMDKDNSGTITVAELKRGIQEKGGLIREQDLEMLMGQADVDGDRTINYTEFIAATISAAKMTQEEHLRTAFEHFDENGDGRISRDELMKALQDLKIKDADEILAQVDADNDGSIDYIEFTCMFRDRQH